MKATAENAAIIVQNEREPVKLLKRIGSTTVEVTVHFSEEGSETMADIVRRLLERSCNSEQPLSSSVHTNDETHNHTCMVEREVCKIA